MRCDLSLHPICAVCTGVVWGTGGLSMSMAQGESLRVNRC